MNTSLLTGILSPKVRAKAYRAYGIVGVALGAIPVWCVATQSAVPVWSVGLVAVYSFIGAPLFGETAKANVTTPADVYRDGHQG